MKRTRPPGQRAGIVIAVIVGVVVLLNVLALGADRAVGGREPSGVSGSSYATNQQGLAAYSALLVRYGYSVKQQRGSLTRNPPPPDSTVIVLDPQVLTEDDAATLLSFATNGGRLVIGGGQPFYLHNLRDRPPEWSPGGQSLWRAETPALPGVRTIQSAGDGSWSDPGAGEVVVGDINSSLLTSERVGRGEMLFLADASPLENSYLALADNAAFGLALAGNRPVIFAEGAHGFGASRGLGAIPTPWKISLVLVLLASIAFVWSRARRFGPPDRKARDLPPARAEYVDALSVTLERTRDRAGALTSAQRFARDRVASRAGLGTAPTDEEIANAARSFGCADDEIAAMLAPVTDDNQVLALGRATARVGGDRRM